MFKINQVKLNIDVSEDKLKEKVAKKLGLHFNGVVFSNFKILHKSLDARDKKNVCFVYNVAFDIKDEYKNKISKNIILEEYNETHFNPFVSKKTSDTIADYNFIESEIKNGKSFIRPVVIGFGPAGLFASYIFAINDLRPIIIERGKKVDERIKDVNKFFETLKLNEESNVCFGEGGAGAFSDGKLNTNNKDKTGIYQFVKETFVKFGADENILYENMPHIGTDKLMLIIKNMRNEIIKLGGDIYYNTKWIYKNGKNYFINVEGENSDSLELRELNEIITNDSPIVIAIGNSSRDTFNDLIDGEFDVKAKTIAIGYRIAHKQKLINKLQYGKEICENSDEREKVFGPASYKLVYSCDDGATVYSFCMCPGGYIINSSNKKGYLSINGMSYNDRAGEFANSAIVTTVNHCDIEDEENAKIENNYNKDKLEAIKLIKFQEKVENKAFELEKGFIPYISNSDKIDNVDNIFKGKAKKCIRLKNVYENCGLKFDLNERIFSAIKYFNKIMPNFYSDDEQYVIAGVETRTSSPIKVDRDENYMCNVRNYYPCGEGLGHGGGIMSSAADGIKVAFSIATTIYSGKIDKKT